MPSEATVETSLADDIIRGADAIGAFIGLDPRQTFYNLQRGVIPATKEGRLWVTTKSRLRRHYNESRFEPSAKHAPMVATRRRVASQPVSRREP
jgi:hypothetical protein